LTRMTAILEILRDGKWHRFEEIEEKTKTDEAKLRRIVEFLHDYNFIIIDESNKKAKIDRTAKEFLTETPTA
jgi:DNA-binding IclR family transcriptional regulator